MPATFRQVTKVLFQVGDSDEVRLEGVSGGEGSSESGFFENRIQIDNIMVKGPGTIDVTIKEIADDPMLQVRDVMACEDNAEHIEHSWPPMFQDGMPMYMVPIRAKVTDTDGSEAITRIVIASDFLEMNVPLDGVKYLIGDQIIGPLSKIQHPDNDLEQSLIDTSSFGGFHYEYGGPVDIQVLGSGYPPSGQTRFDAKAYADGDKPDHRDRAGRARPGDRPLEPEGHAAAA